MFMFVFFLGQNDAVCFGISWTVLLTKQAKAF